jgi:hypothetical protein
LWLYAVNARLSSVKVTFQTFDTSAGPAVQLMKTDNIQTFEVTNFIVSSQSGGSTTVSIYLVPPGGVAGNTNAVILGYKLGANAFIEGHGGLVVPPGGWAIFVSCDTGSACVFTVSGNLGAIIGEAAT